MDRDLKELQLNLLGELPVATLRVTFHLQDGVASRDFWIHGEDENGETVCTWSSRTSAGPAGGVNLAGVAHKLHQVLRLTRGLPLSDGPI